MNIFVASLMALILLVTLVVAEPAPSASVTLDEIAKLGKEEFVVRYYDSDAWGAILKGIGTGDAEWLRVYEALHPSDAGPGEDLDMALYDLALPKNPFAVIPLLRKQEPNSSNDELCSCSFEVDVPPGGIRAFLDTLQQNVERARTEQERVIRDACLRGIAKARREFVHNPEY